MNKSLVERAVESRDPEMAEAALRVTTLRLSKSRTPVGRSLLGKAVLYGVFLRSDEARKSLGLARVKAADNPDIQLQAEEL